MPDHLEDELSIPALVHPCPFCGPLDRESAQNKWSRREPEIRVGSVPVEPDELNGFRLPELPFRDQQFGMAVSEKFACRFKSDNLINA
jgi:hypothetical protein